MKFKNLGNIFVKNRATHVTIRPFKEDLRNTLVKNHNLTPTEAEELVEQSNRTVGKRFAEMTNVIEYTELGYQKALNTIAKSLNAK